MIEIIDSFDRPSNRRRTKVNNDTMVDIPIVKGSFYKKNKNCREEFREMVSNREKEIEIRDKLEIEENTL